MNILTKKFLIPSFVIYLWHHLWRHFAIFHSFKNLIAFLSNLTSFLGNVYHCWCCLIWSEENFGNIFFITCHNIFDLWCHLWRHYNIFSICNFITFMSNLTKFSSWLKLFNLTSSEIHMWKEITINPCIWRRMSFIAVMMQFSTNFTILLPI